MKKLIQIMVMVAMLVGMTFSVPAQKDDKNRPPKKPPVVNPDTNKPPRGNPPPKDERPPRRP
jgi:hypothetical protein